MERTIHRITELSDPNLGPWLDLYQTKFPLDEQVLVSTFIEALRCEETDCRLITVLEAAEVVGMACFQLIPEVHAAYLWYLAAEPEGQGIGSWTYRRLIEMAGKELPGLRAIAFEVERPEDSRDEHSRDLALRRIDFYRRAGARLCGNIRYFQDVGWQPRIPMHLMIHPLDPISLTVEDARGILHGVFGSALEDSDALVFE